jgi:hypothetical protein
LLEDYGNTLATQLMVCLIVPLRRDTIYAMLSAGDLLESRPPPPPSLKRDRDSDTASASGSQFTPGRRDSFTGSHDVYSSPAYSSPGAASTSGSDFSVQPRSIAGSRRCSPPEPAHRGVAPQAKPHHFLPVHSAELGRLPVQHFEIANPFVPNTHLSAGDFVSEGMDGWSASLLPQPDHDPLSRKVLPSDFFSSLLDNTLGAAEGENPEWAYAPATDATCVISTLFPWRIDLFHSQLDKLGSIHAWRDPRHTTPLILNYTKL